MQQLLAAQATTPDICLHTHKQPASERSSGTYQNNPAAQPTLLPDLALGGAAAAGVLQRGAACHGPQLARILLILLVLILHTINNKTSCSTCEEGGCEPAHPPRPAHSRPAQIQQHASWHPWYIVLDCSKQCECKTKSRLPWWVLDQRVHLPLIDQRSERGGRALVRRPGSPLPLSLPAKRMAAAHRINALRVQLESSPGPPSPRPPTRPSQQPIKHKRH